MQTVMINQNFETTEREGGRHQIFEIGRSAKQIDVVKNQLFPISPFSDMHTASPA
jgi:hypothetical protein